MQLQWPPATYAPIRADDEAHAWAVPLVVDDAAWQALWDILSADERERAEEFRFAELRRRFVVAHGVLRKLLGRYLGQQPETIAFSLDGGGKPRLASDFAATNLNFNLSHSGDLALILVATGCEIGVDVEQIRDVSRLEHIARRFFHASEFEELSALAPASRNAAFLRCWTAKEAVLKAYGTGIAESLDAFQAPLAESFEDWIDLSTLPNTDKGSQCWLRRLTPCDDYVAAAAFMGSQRRVRCFAFSA